MDFIQTAAKTVNMEMVPCPLMPMTTTMSWSFDESFEKLVNIFNFMLPAGDYKMEVRLYNRTDNYTYHGFTGKLNIKAVNGIHDMSMLAMG